MRIYSREPFQLSFKLVSSLQDIMHLFLKETTLLVDSIVKHLS